MCQNGQLLLWLFVDHYKQKPKSETRKWTNWKKKYHYYMICGCHFLKLVRHLSWYLASYPELSSIQTESGSIFPDCHWSEVFRLQWWTKLVCDIFKNEQSKSHVWGNGRATYWSMRQTPQLWSNFVIGHNEISLGIIHFILKGDGFATRHGFCCIKLIAIWDNATKLSRISGLFKSAS